MVKAVNSNTFDAEVLQAKGLVVVDMYADWCGPCKMMAPIIDTLSEDYEDVTFCKLNVDEADDIAARYGVMSSPTFLLVKDGQVVKTLVGAKDAESFENEIEAFR